MTWTELILSMLLCLLLAGLLGAVIGWLLRTLFGGRRGETEWRNQLSSREREMEALRVESRKQLTVIEGQLANCQASVKTHLATVADHEANYAQLQAMLQARNKAYDDLSTEVSALKDELATTEGMSEELEEKLATAEASLTSNRSALGDLTTKLAAATALTATLKGSSTEAEKLKAENELLRQRLGGLETSLTAAQEREAKAAAAAQDRDRQVGELQKQIGDLQARTKSQSEDWELRFLTTAGDKDREIRELQKRVGELEPLGARAKDWELKYLAVMDVEKRESAGLRARVAELEPLSNQLSSIRDEARTKDTQISALEARVRELEAAPRAAPASDLIRIEGIGPVYFEKLSSKAGLWMQADLLERGKTTAGRKEIAAQTGIDEGLILRWVNHCDLRRIHGVDEQYAELLEVAGVDTVPELAQRNPENLHAKLVATNEEKHTSPHTPAADEVRRWVEQAKTLPRVVTH